MAITEETLRAELAAGKSLSQIARETNNHVGYLSRRAKKLNLKSEHASTPKKSLPLQKIHTRYYEGTSLYALAIEYGTSVPTLKRQLSKTFPNVEYRSRDDAMRPPLLNSKEALEEALCKQSCSALARELGVKVATVTKAVRGFGLATWSIVHDDIPVAELDDLYNKQKVYPSAIATRYNLPYGVVLRQIRKAGFKINDPGGISTGSIIKQLNDKEWLEHRYKEASIGDIACLVNTSVGNVAYHMRRLGVKLRSRQEYLEALQNQHGRKTRVGDITCDSKLEAKFIETLAEDERRNLVRDIPFESHGSDCFIDFVLNGDHIEVKSKSQSNFPGPERSRLIKQFMICKHNDVILRVWNGGYVDIAIEDLDRYYAANWRLMFSTAQECYDFLVDFGFQGLQFKMADMTDGLQKLVNVKPGRELDASYPNADVLKIIKHFSQHYWRSTRDGFLPVSAVWEVGNRVILRDALNIVWDNMRESNIYGLVKCICKEYKDFLQPSIFKPWIAHHLYKRYLPDGGTVVDPCVGWGGRLLGCSDLDIHYIGYDVNANCIESMRRLAKFANCKLRHKPEFLMADSTTVKFEEADLAICCPPYDGLEKYEGALESSMMSILANVLSHQFKTVILIVPNARQNDVLELAGNDYRLIDQLEMTSAGIIRRERYSELILVLSGK